MTAEIKKIDENFYSFNVKTQRREYIISLKKSKIENGKVNRVLMIKESENNSEKGKGKQHIIKIYDEAVNEFLEVMNKIKEIDSVK
ncbi:MAG: hypothetical protein QXG00_04085 [Candidatus Woesearchaeota archaeon]